MRKVQKQEILEFINSLHQAHVEVKEALRHGNYDSVRNMLSECQEFAVALGENIEEIEGEGHITVSHLEEYCETLFQIFEKIKDGQINVNRIYDILKEKICIVENSVKNDIFVRKEVVFFPYKASMWDSLESVYLAAKEDPECDVYCVPIPYFDINQDHSYGEMHYEGNEYPEDVEVVDWERYNFEDRRPDAIYIHNPYDGYNLVTAVHPRFYSSNLKKYTETLVYIPYYSTSGKMSEAQSLCPAYIYADYIVIQAPQFRAYFDVNLPDCKFLPFGSPKFDRVIKKCQTRPEPLAEWKDKMAGRKVYFYNTSIAGMLVDTEAFLKKMNYVFQCFDGREDSCLLWRPHPLLETTFHSLRPQYRQIYEALKRLFLVRNLGILDMTSDIGNAIALSDAYIGDSGTSVTSLFGIVGKPLFIMDNRIHKKPEKDDWLYELDIRYSSLEDYKFIIAQGDRLYLSESDQFKYKYFCDLSDYARTNHYSLVYEIKGKYYVCPEYAQNILVVDRCGVEKVIDLHEKVKNSRAFSFAWKYKEYLILIPFHYPAVVRYNTESGEIRYFDKHIDVFIKEKEGQKTAGSSLIYRDELYIGSPVDNRVYKMHIKSGRIQVVNIPTNSRCGCFQLIEYKNELWILPYNGAVIVRWNPLTDEIREYSCADFLGECEGPLFNLPAFYEEYMYLTPACSNMYLKLNINTGEFIEWCPSFEEKEECVESEKSTFMLKRPNETAEDFKLYSYTRRKLYSISDLELAECKEIVPEFDFEELRSQERGFCECSGTLRYACMENYFNSLEGFLDGKIVGGQFDQQRQLSAYKAIISNYDGDCGQKVHEFVKKRS